jgi:hypothetical protein
MSDVSCFANLVTTPVFTAFFANTAASQVFPLLMYLRHPRMNVYKIVHHPLSSCFHPNSNSVPQLDISLPLNRLITIPQRPSHSSSLSLIVTQSPILAATMPGQNNCNAISPSCPLDQTIYGYYPTLPGNAFFLAIFAVLTLSNLVLGLRFRTYTYAVAMVFGCLGEAIGYLGRVLLHSNPYSNVGFEMQICCLIISPAFIAAAIYLTLKHTVLVFGPEHSRIKPKFYTWIFICCDIFTLVLQGAGGGIAASANTDSLQKIGNDLMMAGIVLQVVILLAFGIASTDFLLRLRRAFKTKSMKLSPEAHSFLADTKFQLFAAGIVVAYLTVFTRCCYRIAEMSGGWANPIMQNERDFIVLDGTMVLVASLCLTILHPGYCFPRLATGGKSRMGDVEKRASESSIEEK